MVTNLDKKQIDLIKESLCVYEKAQECKTLLRQQKLYFENIQDFVDDRGRSCLFRLKEMCHDLFRNSVEASYKEKLFDITVGYTFHGAMKLRENLYLLQYYQPQSEIALHDLSPQERKIVNEIGMLVRKAQGRLKEEFKEVAILSNELVEQLKDLIVLYKDNYLLSRFLYENEKLLLKTYGRKGFQEILSTIYANGRKHLMHKTATSYLDSEYFETARTLFKRIIRTDNEDRNAQFLYLYASANYFYFKNMFTRALSLAERAKAMKAGENVGDRYREPLDRLIADLTGEIKKKKS
jgi:tetratricopeptide (TPR) repeat protein